MSASELIKELEMDFKRLAKSGKLAHGYIFFGPSRTAKKNFAFSFARYLEEGDFYPIGVKSSEKTTRVLSDTLQIFPDENGVLGIDRIREMKNFLWQKPNRSAYRTVILADGEKLTDEAQNAMLRIAEEPPPSALVLLLIDDPERLYPTLQSRFQKVFFARGKDETESGLEEYKEAAKQFLIVEGIKRAGLIKELVGNENFDLDRFLEALLVITPVHRNNFNFLHAVLELRRQINYFNLNPRLQLTALSRIINR